MTMKEHVHIARRFLRSIRIDADLDDARALDGFICPQSSADVLLMMAQHVSETGQGAFTWTGPYGSGKSSLVIALSALLNGNRDLKNQAAKIFGRELTTTMWNAMPTGTEGWRILPVLGRRDQPVQVIGEAMETAGFVRQRPCDDWTENQLIKAVTDVASTDPHSWGGLIIFIDEMGKFLEVAAQESADVYIFQHLAEAASRSNGRLLIVGILHQAFDEYAHRLSREVRDEWAKIQGRFIDLSVNVSGEEQIDLISHAIESNAPSNENKLPRTVATLIHPDRTASADRLALVLENCWPLHPVVASLLGPISRRRFGQNQRSIFGFLNSAEPHGFQEFLNRANDRMLYEPNQLWNYLRANLEPSILASPDGHRWALAVEALERCEAIGGDELHIRLLKTIAVIDLFKERSGLLPSVSLLQACLPDTSKSTLKNALDQLTRWSFTIFKKFLDAYSIYAGSDFDIDEAVRRELADVDDIDFATLKSLAGLQPVLAKRHYHETGTLRWLDVDLIPLRDMAELVEKYQPATGSIGQFLLVVPTDGENEEVAEKLCRKTTCHSGKWDVIAGISKRSCTIIPLARELIALDNVRQNRPELHGDAVARREVEARLITLQGLLEGELHKAFDSARWFRKHHSPKNYRHADLNVLASQLADQRFAQCPKLHNELLNRQKPSSSAVAGQNTLLRKMVLNEGKPRLGIDGFPAEGGLFVSLLEATKLYTKSPNDWHFTSPQEDDPHRLGPIWEVAAKHIQANCKRTVAICEIYDLWRNQPYGVKDGLMPILAVAFILSQRNKIAVYREGIFRARFDDVDVDYLSKDASSIQLRWMDLSDVSRHLLSGMAEIVRDLDNENTLVHLEPIDVARGLVGIFERLPSWSKRTMRLSANAVRVRDLFKRARDPNKFLFDDIPEIVAIDIDPSNNKNLQRIISGLRDGLEELVKSYPSMLHRLRNIMLTELQVPNMATQSLSELRGRAVNIRQLAGDFHLEAFVGRLSQFDDSDSSFESIASLAANKPPRDWVDPDLDRAMVDIADMSQKFLRAETFSRVKGRPEKRHAMAVVLGLNGRPEPILKEFHLADTDRKEVDALIERIDLTLGETDASQRSIILAALAELSARYMVEPKSKNAIEMEDLHYDAKY